MSPSQRLARSPACIVAAAGIFIGACTTAATSRVSPPARAPEQGPPPRRDIRDLAIIPASEAVCPGQPITARYEAILGDGSRVRLAENELSRLALRGIGASPAADGSWTTSANPLHSVATGFRLSASLATDPGVHADTVIVPSYTCGRTSFGLPPSDRYHDTKARVRVGVFPSPFYDSIVVAAIEVEGRIPLTIVLDPPHMRIRGVQVSAVGKAGATGRAGNPGNNGAQCEDGTDGTDGEPGEAGESGGEVDIVIQAEAPWLASLVAVVNSGGKGGAGGRGGRGGLAGPRTNEPTCAPKPGRTGRGGTPGPDGAPGPYPTTTMEDASLLWRGSAVWFDSTARTNLEQLMKLNPRRR